MSAHTGHLFNDLPLPEDTKGLVKIPSSSKHLDPDQRSFNRLTDQVHRLREEVAQWQMRLNGVRQRGLSELLPVIEAMQQAQIEQVKQIDALLSRPGKTKHLTRKRRDTLAEYLLWLLEPLLKETQDPELVAIHDRHSVLTHAESAELERELARGLLGDMFGEEALEGFADGDLEDILAHAQARLDEHERTRSARKPSRKAQRAVEIKQEADQAVRETFRKLASHLHPDRETDEAARQRKTELMQRANDAYAKNDLLTLLTLQLECEQLDADQLAELPEARIQRFNHALREQVRALEAEKQQIIDQIADLLDTSPGIIATVDGEDRLFDDRLQTARDQLEVLRARTQALADPARQRQAIDDIVAEMRSFDEVIGMDEFTRIVERDIYTDAPQPRRRAKRRNNRRL